MTGFPDWFLRVTGQPPHGWQAEFGAESRFDSRLIRVPTGLGKTLGVLLAWAYHRIHRKDGDWPRRLVWCLPMRTLVEQTHAEAERMLRELGVLWDGRTDHVDKVGVHLLMGGADAGEWHLWPEESAILVGTQDMLLSRALNRGYAAARARWPMDFGLINQDCVWVMDEVQLMDVGLATSAQLQAFREGAAAGGRPAGTWWMSATLQPAWLSTRDTGDLVARLPRTTIPPAMRKGWLWDDVTKVCEIVADIAVPKQLAKRVAVEHAEAGSGTDGPTLVVVNTVDRAVEVAKLLQKQATGAEIRLVHSRFRPAERAGWREAFLNRTACAPGTNRIIVATQVVEAGVDLSAALLVTDLAPWPNLVQRFGRAARWGGAARVLVVDAAPKDDKAAAPYGVDELDAARAALQRLADVAPASLERFEEQLASDELARLYPYEPAALLLRHEVDELFDTSADLSGADIDISRFIRSGEERDLQVFWAELPDEGGPPADLRPTREALCTVPFLKARDWLCGKQRVLRERRSAWVWSWVEGAWREAESRDLYPGQTVLVDAAHGGYDWDPAKQWGVGFNAESSERVPEVATSEPTAAERADSAQDDESLSATSSYRTIATHGEETGALAAEIARRIGADCGALLELAGQWHDVGKAHPAFQGSIHALDRPDRVDLAKAPKNAWPRPKLYRLPDGSQRRGFRHELASALALFAVLQRRQPDHPALLGPWKALFAALGDTDEVDQVVAVAGKPLEQAILALSAEEFDLLAYLVASHHGKVRVSLHATSADQESMEASGEITIRGVRTGDLLPSIAFGPPPGADLPATKLDLGPAAMGLSPRTGASWTDRILGLVRAHGPFRLAWLEALLRAADQRASRITSTDPRLSREGS